MQNYTKRKFILIFFVLLLNASTLVSFAAYDVVRATTIEEKKEGLFIDENTEAQMYEDADLERIDTQEDLSSIIERKFKKFFKKD